MHDKVALAFDQDRQCDRFELAVVFKSLELIELEDSARSTTRATSLQLRIVKIGTHFGHPDKPTLDRLAID